MQDGLAVPRYKLEVDPSVKKIVFNKNADGSKISVCDNLSLEAGKEYYFNTADSNQGKISINRVGDDVTRLTCWINWTSNPCVYVYDAQIWEWSKSPEHRMTHIKGDAYYFDLPSGAKNYVIRDKDDDNKKSGDMSYPNNSDMIEISKNN